jgi:Zn-dependent protease
MEKLLISLPILIFSIVCHEVAHGWVARQQGDNTAAMLGRLTLNPIPHIDPIGSILVPALMALLPGGMMFGWAKPVPVNPRNFRNFKKGDILVSLAGVTVNLILGFLFALLLVAVQWLAVSVPALAPSWQILMAMLQYGIVINFVLMLFNLIPIPPLDGSHVFYYLLPPRLGMQYRQMGRFGMIIIFGLLYLTGFTFLSVPLGWLLNVAGVLIQALGPV